MTPQLTPLFVCQFQQINSVVGNVAGGNPARTGQQSHNRTDHGGLAAAGLADDTADFSFFQVQAAVFNCKVLAIGNIYIFNL